MGKCSGITQYQKSQFCQKVDIAPLCCQPWIKQNTLYSWHTVTQTRLEGNLQNKYHNVEKASSIKKYSQTVEMCCIHMDVYSNISTVFKFMLVKHTTMSNDSTVYSPSETTNQHQVVLFLTYSANKLEHLSTLEIRRLC